MYPNPLCETLRAGRVALGLCNMYPASGIIEGMAKGWDFVWIDGQHGEQSYESILHAVQACRATGVESLIRVPGHEHSLLGKYADLAPAAVMAPMVNNRAEAEHIRDGLRFPPLGVRSYGGRRLIDLYGRDGHVERELLAVAQIETLQAVANADEIIGVDGIDVLFFGPDDMKLRMGLPMGTPATDSPELREALATTARAARDAGKFCAGVAPDPATLTMMAGMGYQLLIGGSDIGFLRTLSASKLDELRAASDAAASGGETDGRSGVY